jgi:hypothetical protein
MTGALVAGLAAFCLVFAVNSSVHSYLIVRYADGDKVRRRLRWQVRRAIVTDSRLPDLQQ